MNNKFLYLSGIKKINKDYTIVLTDEVENEIQELLRLEKKHKNSDSKKKCVFCYHHIEAMNDYCEIKEKRTLCFDLCDQFTKKITVLEAEALKYFEDFQKD